MKISRLLRIVALILVLLFVTALVSIIFSGCSGEPVGSSVEAISTKTSNTWALIKVGGGEPLHVEVVQWQATSSGNIYIYTKDRMYMTSAVNVLIIKETG